MSPPFHHPFLFFLPLLPTFSNNSFNAFYTLDFSLPQHFYDATCVIPVMFRRKGGQRDTLIFPACCQVSSRDVH